jgi:hypothetical protein
VSCARQMAYRPPKQKPAAAILRLLVGKGAEGLGEFEDARFGDGWAILVEEWDGGHESAEDPNGLFEEGGEQGGGLEDLFHKRHAGGVHCVACGRGLRMRWGEEGQRTAPEVEKVDYEAASLRRCLLVPYC